jgi:hypothetical protein
VLGHGFKLCAESVVKVDEGGVHAPERVVVMRGLNLLCNCLNLTCRRDSVRVS